MNQDHANTRGLFGIRDNSEELDLSLDERFIKNPISTFFFHMKGMAMSPLICDGDVLIVDRSLPMAHDKVAVVSYQGEMLCRRLYLRRGVFKLMADHPRYQTIVVQPEDFSFFGVATSLVREKL